jgi:hypothetical protein
MKILILATALIGFTGILPASAGVTCQKIGNFTYCTDSYGGRTTCQKIGSFTYCN